MLSWEHQAFKSPGTAQMAFTKIVIVQGDG